MVFPLITDYTTAIRNSATRFTTLELVPKVDENGAPTFMAGNFAAVYRGTLKSHGQTVAVKCFIRDMPDLEKRYKAITAMIARVKSPLFINLKYLPNELFVHSTTAGNGNYPVLVMPWIEGRTLDKVIRDLSTQKKQNGLASLTRAWARLCLGVLSMGVAHGDLKPDNIMAAPDAVLKLIDYESFYVPALKGLPSLVLGGPHFQHPLRETKHFDTTIDHFSMLVITLSLRALALSPGLYDRCNNGENILFTKSDFLAPRQSKLVNHLLASRDTLTREWTKRLIASLASKSIAVPGLDVMLKQAEKSTVETAQSPPVKKK
ncbi:MAG: protein kinase domain-containing protein [Alphaproteobacteria bacterium]